MIDTERVKMMTKMTLREKRSGIRLDTVDDPDRRDFMSFCGVLAFFRASIFYAVIFVVAVLFIFSMITVKVSRLTIAVTVFAGIIGYLFFLLVYSGHSRRQTIKRFDKYQQIVKEQRSDLKILEEIYEKEERDSHGQQEKTIDRNDWNEDRPGDKEPNQ